MNYKVVDKPPTNLEQTSTFARKEDFTVVEEQEVREKLRPLLRWWWALLLLPVVCSGLAYFLTKQLPHYYQASMVLSVGPAVKDIEDQLPYNIISNLSASYRDLITRENFLELVAAQPGSQQTVEQLKKSIVVQATGGSPYFEIFMVDTNSYRLLGQLTTISNLLSGSSLQLKQLQLSFQKQFIVDRLSELNQLIAQRREDLKTLGDQPLGQDEQNNNNLQSAAQEVNGEIEAYQKEIRDLTGLVNNPEANQVNLVEKPHLVQAKIGPQPFFATLTVGLLSLLLGAGFIVILDKIENTVHTGKQAVSLVKRAVPTNLQPGKIMANNDELCLLAVELFAIYVIQQKLKRVRLLVLYEENTPTVPAKLNELARELYKLGNLVKVVNVGNEFILEPDASDNFVGVFQNIPGSDTGNFNTPIIRPPVFEIISHPWSNSLNYLIMENHEYAGALIGCSLKVSTKTGLVALSRFLVRARFQIMGLIVF